MKATAVPPALEAVLAWAGGSLPNYYHRFLLDHPAGISTNLAILYPVEIVIERNDTYETRKYCPGHITIGDDSGGRAVVVSLQDEAGAVFLVDHGDMTPEGFEPIAPSFQTWLDEGCPLADEPGTSIPLLGDLHLLRAPPNGLRDLLRLKSVLNLNWRVVDMRAALSSTPLRVARSVNCVGALGRLRREAPDLVTFVGVSEQDHPEVTPAPTNL